MACSTCTGRVSLGVANTNSYVETNVGGNEVYNIPLKVGEALSTACERANLVGSVPDITYYPQFTKVAGGVIGRSPFPAGFSEASLKIFMRAGRDGCYGENTVQASTCRAGAC